ncbi:MAG TPA: ATP-binding protein [Brevundimonas sp.]|jgi:signal transduction histidine kinase
MSLSRALETPTGTLAKAPTRVVARAGLSTNTTRLFSQPLVPMATVSAVLLLTLFSIRFGMSADGAVVMWVANAVGVGVWLRMGRGVAFDICFAAMMAVAVASGEFLAGYSPQKSGVLTAINVFEMVAAVTLVRRFSPDLSMQTVRSVLRLIAVAVIGAPFVAACAGAIALFALKGVPMLEGFQVWWFGHSLGMLLVLPMILSLNARSLDLFRRPLRMVEWVGLLGMLGAVVYGRYYLHIPVIAVFLNLLLVVIAARLRISGLTVAMLVTAVIALGALLQGQASPSAEPAGIRVMSAQLMLISVTLPFMLVAVLLSERDGLSARARAGQKRAELASEAKSRLLANVAHEIKSPVAGVIGIGDLWSSGGLGPVTATQKEMADMLVKTARQVEALAHDLLDVARAESGAVKVELRPTDVSGVAEDVRRATALRPEARNLRLEVVREGDGLIALADSQRLSQVIDNLATNAVKYGGSGGVVTFRVSRVFEGVRIEVIDQGPGLSAEKQTQLFEPFNRLGLERSTVEGHGIGLALAKRLVELQGGVIGVDSEPGQGATFWVELPAA